MSVRLITKRAMSQIGVPYRLHARLPGVALDCAGLAGFAALGKKCSDLPTDYALRGDTGERIHPVLARARFRKLDAATALKPGDIVLCQTAPRQLHLMVCVPEGFVHGHASLRRIVLTPYPSLWPIIHIWRPIIRNRKSKWQQ